MGRFSNEHEFEEFSAGVRMMGFLVVSLIGLVLGGTMIVAGQLVCVLLDQRELLVRIHEALTRAEAEARPRTGGGIDA
jgi:hypothetical protein